MNNQNIEYAIKDSEGNYLTSPNETGSGRFIALMTKEQATLELYRYNSGRGYKIAKVKVTE